jgi:Xaa-Pro aminopeptidase
MAVEEKNPWTPEWSNAVFSLAERDLRWAKVRKLMARDGIDVIFCFPCTNSHDRGQADARYLTQLGENSDECVVAFPIEGPVTAWHSRGGVWPSSNWFADIRPTPRGTGGATAGAWLNENPKYKSGTIAIAGLDSSILAHIRSAEGEANWQSVDILKRNFPQARFVSATPVLGEARWRKSAEEIEFLRKGTLVAEKMLDAVNQHARPGVRERHIFAHLMFASADADGSFTPMIGWSSGPDGRAYHRVEQPSFRTFKDRDVLLLEIEGRWGGYIAQIDQTWGIGSATQDLRDAIKMAFEAYDRVVAKLKPGVTVRELIDAATFTGMNGRAKTGLGGHGRGTGDDGPLLVAGRPEPKEVLDLVIEEGCSFVIKPSVILDGVGDFARWGEMVAVTRSGAERLGTRPQEMRILV